MAKFKQIKQNTMFPDLMKYWSNLIRNYNEKIDTEDVFEIVQINLARDMGLELIRLAYTDYELKAMTKSAKNECKLDLNDSLSEIFRSIWNNEQARDKCRTVLESIGDYLLKANVKSVKNKEETSLDIRFNKLKDLLLLSDVEIEILKFAYVKDGTCFTWPFRIPRRDKPTFYAMAIDRSIDEVMTAANEKGRLKKLELIDNDLDFNYHALEGFITGTDDEALRRSFYRKADDKDILPWSYFGELSANDGMTIRKMIQAAHGRCNILFYGAPGTGKTSFARSVARELSRNAFEIMQGDENGKHMHTEARFIGIQICNDQENVEKSMMIIDEADELLCTANLFDEIGMRVRRGGSTDKGVINSVMDDMKMPAIWISNAPAGAIDESIRRRFDYSVCFERMNTAQRLNIWKNLIEKHGLKDLISEDKIAHLADEYQTSAGGISTVLKNVKQMAPSPDEAEELIAKLMKPHCQLMGIRERRDFLPAKGYSLDGLNIKSGICLGKIVKAMKNFLNTDFSAADEDKPRMNLLMFGPPGTGKTDFVKYLGKELLRKVLVVKGSDILGKFVGENEQNIAAAFRKAESEGAILFFDEIDGLVQNRESASMNWEVSTVNEILQQMENFNGIMIAATNFRKNLDPAIMRRFTFKIEFDYLDNEGKKKFFQRMFKRELSEKECAALFSIENLTPGDFRTVRQNRFYLGDEETNSDLIYALKEESDIKTEGIFKKAVVGFN